MQNSSDAIRTGSIPCVAICLKTGTMPRMLPRIPSSRLSRNLRNFKPKASFYTWLYRIAINTCLDRQKRPLFASLFKWLAHGEESTVEAQSNKPSPEEICETRQLGQALHIGLNRLSPRLRAVIFLREIDGFPRRDAEVLEVSVGTVKSRISRAKEEMRRMMIFFREQN